jgi:hypothetical protein
LELNEAYVEAWKAYIVYLRKCNIILNDDEDELIWSLNPTGGYEPKFGYKALALEGIDQPLIWWWKSIWKFKCLTKVKKFHVASPQ